MNEDCCGLGPSAQQAKLGQDLLQGSGGLGIKVQGLGFRAYGLGITCSLGIST